MRPWLTSLALSAALATVPALAQEADPVLVVGQAAPAFSLPGSDGGTYSLEEFKGKKAVVIAWFPKAFTGG